MKIYGLIGFPLGHSWSPNFFNNKFRKDNINAEYQLFELESIDQFSELLKRHVNLAGLNVTIPYKQKIKPYLDGLSVAAKTIGAVNTIVFQEEKLIGHNTDAFGFESTLELLQVPDKCQALILGTGGSSKAVQYVLGQKGIDFTLVSRTKTEQHITYADLDKAIIKQHNLIVNCTPIGMSPNTNDCPGIPYKYLSEDHFVIDLVYNPRDTEFLQRAAAKKAKTIGGLHMLHQQANKAWQLWQAK
jgi:shikimate dehydrogenase